MNRDDYKVFSKKAFDRFIENQVWNYMERGYDIQHDILDRLSTFQKVFKLSDREVEDLDEKTRQVLDGLSGLVKLLQRWGYDITEDMYM